MSEYKTVCMRIFSHNGSSSEKWIDKLTNNNRECRHVVTLQLTDTGTYASWSARWMDASWYTGSSPTSLVIIASTVTWNSRDSCINWHLLFHRLTRTAYLYNGCMALYNVVLTSQIHSSVKYSQASTVTAAVSCDGGISVLNHCLSWSKFVNTYLYHSRQWFNIH